jgi:long-chain acyl-CoA synthetase
MSLVCVPLYETLGDDAIEFIIDHSTTSLVAVAGKRAPGLIKGLKKLKKDSLKTVVYWGDIAPKDLEVCEGLVLRRVWVVGVLWEGERWQADCQ